MAKPFTYKLLFATPLFILLAHTLAVLPHEYAHSLMAWFLGYKLNPFDINYGGNSWLNLFLLFHIDENVDYNLIIAQGHLKHVALIAFAGPGIANGLLYLLYLYLLAKKKVQQDPLLFYFIFWFNFMNLANFYAYIPIRTFSPNGDIALIAQGLTISPWYIYIIFGYLVAFIIWHFYTSTLMQAFIHLRLATNTAKASLMITCTIVLFGYFGMAGYSDNGAISHFLSTTSLILIPGAIVACWPKREWVQRDRVR